MLYVYSQRKDTRKADKGQMQESHVLQKVVNTDRRAVLNVVHGHAVQGHSPALA